MMNPVAIPIKTTRYVTVKLSDPHKVLGDLQGYENKVVSLGIIGNGINSKAIVTLVEITNPHARISLPTNWGYADVDEKNGVLEFEIKIDFTPEYRDQPTREKMAVLKCLLHKKDSPSFVPIAQAVILLELRSTKCENKAINGCWEPVTSTTSTGTINAFSNDTEWYSNVQ